LRYSAYNDTWTPPPTILAGHRSEIEATVDASTSTLLIASKHADASTPLTDQAPLQVELDTLQVPGHLFGNGTQDVGAPKGCSSPST